MVTTDISSSISQPEPVTTSSPAKCHPGLTVVTDNIDKTARLRDQQMDAQSKSLHYAQAYAVKDQIEYSQLSNMPPPPVKSVYDLLPSTSDYQALIDNFAALIAHILVKDILIFAGLQKAGSWSHSTSV